jgi:hypothetical protein
VFVVQVVVVLILVMPMPTNYVRGYVARGFSSLWKNNPSLRNIAFMLFLLNVMAFVLEMRTLYFNPPPLEKFPGPDGFMERRMQLFRTERNAYLTGMSCFVYFVMTRLVQIQLQLYDARNAQKIAEDVRNATEAKTESKKEK